MKIKVFAIIFIGALVIMGISSLLVYSQLRTVANLNLDPLADSLYREDSKILAWILSTIPEEKLDTLKLPESWAEIFLVNNSDLQLVSSSNAKHRGVTLERHPLLLDKAQAIISAMNAGKPSTVSVKDYMVITQPIGTDKTMVALKPKAWEKGLVSQQDNRIRSTSSDILMILGIFLAVGVLVTVVMAFIITRIVAAPTSRALEALQALSLGEFDYEIKDSKSREMTSFYESYLRLKTSLEMALERLSRR